MADRHVLVVPNGDGFGPSALCSHVVRDLLSRHSSLRVTIRTGKALYNARLFGDTGRVTIEAATGGIRLEKVKGRTSIPKTLAALDQYCAWSKAFPIGDDVDVVFEFGVPAAARRASERGIPRVSLFDHCWSRTLVTILEEQQKSYESLSHWHQWSQAEQQEWLQLAARIQEDEAATNNLFTLPPFLTPEAYTKYWREEIGVEPRQLDGVLGGSPSRSRAQACAALGLTDPVPAILVQGGDTPAWDGVLPRLIDELRQREGRADPYVVIYAPERLGLAPLQGPRLKMLGPPSGGTIQEILPAIDFMVTRAGGGSVNDAVACRVPFVCVEEPGHAQVMAILDACEARGLTRRIGWSSFSAAAILDAWRSAHGTDVLRAVPNGAERTVAAAILSCL